MTTESTLQLVTGTPAPPPEEWRDIPGMEGEYAASSLGRIMSYKRDPRGRLMQLSAVNGRGRIPTLTFTPVSQGHKSGLTVARAVALAFLGQPPNPVMEARHLSGDIQDNRPENLVWSF